MRSILSENHNKIDAVIAEDDGMASGAIAALKEVGLDGKVALAGQGGTIGSTSTTSPRVHRRSTSGRTRGWMGKAAGDAAVALCKNPDISKLQGTTVYTSPGNNQIPSILLTPQAITKDNLNVVIDAGWVTKADVCASIAPSKAPPACH